MSIMYFDVLAGSIYAASLFVIVLGVRHWRRKNVAAPTRHDAWFVRLLYGVAAALLALVIFAMAVFLMFSFPCGAPSFVGGRRR